MFFLPARAKYPFFRLQLMDYIRGWRNFHAEPACFLLLFGDKKIAFKSPFDPYFHPLIFEFFWFASLQFKIEEKIHIKGVSGLSPATLLKKETLAQVFSYEFCQISKNIFCYRTLPVAASPNRGYLHCAVLKALHGFEKKRALSQGTWSFFFKLFQMRFWRFSKYLKT